MSKIAIVTDSNSGITQAMGEELGVYVIPMPFYINGELFFEDISLSQEEFYQKLGEDAEISTSQPSPGDVMDLWEKLLKEYDEIVHIPMSSGLSSTCENAISLSMEYDEKVQVVNNQRISVTQEQSVKDALVLRDAGKSAKEIKEILEANKLNASIYITVNTLDYLRKGGRITPAVAILGGMMKIKPILQIQGEKLDTFSKTRTMSKATKIMMEAIKKDIDERLDPEGKGKNVHVCIAYTYDEQPALELKKELEAIYPDSTIICDPLSLSVSCHIGPHALAIAACKKII